MAQVYSVNAVGYVNLSLPAGFSMIANQFTQTNYSLNALIPNPPPATQIYKFTGTGYSIYTFDDIDLVWLPNGNDTLDLGGGVFISLPSAATITFVGEVPQGTLVTPTPTGFSIRSSQVPQAGSVSALGFQGEAADQIYKLVSGAYQIFTFDDIDLVWLPSEPALAVGESFFLSKAPGGSPNWTRTFTVN